MSWGSYTWAGAPWAGLYSPPADEDTPTYSLELQLTIAGIDRTNLLVPSTLKITDELGERNSCEFRLLDTSKSVHLSCGEIVRITYNGGIIFGGTIDEVEEGIPQDIAPLLEIGVKCVDYTELADRHIVAKRFTTANQTLRDVVLAIVTTDSGDTGETLDFDGVTTTAVQTGPTLKTVTFDYKTVAECFDDLSDLTGFSWYIDYEKKLHFFDIAQYVAPQELNDTKWTNYRNLKVLKSRNEYRNVQYLRAGTGTTETARVEEFKGDGKKTTYSLAMPVGEKPTIAVDTVAVDPSYVVVRKDETEQTGKWYYKIGDKDISHDSDETPLSSSNTLTVTYKGQYDILQIARDDDEVDERKSIQGGTGIYVNVEEDDSVDDLEMAIEKSLALLRKYGRIETTVTFETDADGFRSGQMLRVNLPDHGMTGEFLIDSVDFSDIDFAIFRYRIHAVQNERMSNWVDFYRRLANKGRPFELEENQSVTICRLKRDGIGIGDAVSLTTTAADWDDYGCVYGVISVSHIGGTRRAAITSSPVLEPDGVNYGPMIGDAR